ncbi:MAG: efflux RND transporter periplasmic adaptor subunit [Acidaminococcaceae bacterium]|nr:efflux RND transporter periplasmic adaptor subunit [Acidaminococcaceae bacterium]
MKFIKDHLLLLILLLVVAAGCFGGYRYYKAKQEDGTKTVKTAAVQYGELRKTVSATGSLSAVDNVDISSKITGRIVQVNVAENDHVTAGQLLVKLDETSLKQTELQKKAQMDDSLLTLNRDQEMLNRGAISQQTYDTALMNYKVAKAAYDAAVANTNDTNIYSPIDGYVIGKPTPVGQTISSGISTPQVIMSIANLDNMQIEAMVDESDVGQVSVGQKVEFTVDSFADETFTGTVRLISRSATTTNNVVYYKVYIDVANSQGKLFPTMTARSNIIISQKEDVLNVPLNCIFYDGGEPYVKKYDAATKKETKVSVTLGLSGDENVEVTADGLKEGDKLVVKQLTSKQTNTGGPGGPPM